MTTEDSEKSRPTIPLVCRFAEVASAALGRFERDVPAIEERLPAVLATDAAGHALARQTRRTYFERETTDDE
jgi:hypothetical protein